MTRCVRSARKGGSIAWRGSSCRITCIGCVQLHHESLGQCLQRFKSRSARAVNMANGMQGPLWQSGYYEHQLRGSEDLAKQARYLVDNPVRKGLVATLEDYPFWWSRWIASSNDMT